MLKVVMFLQLLLFLLMGINITQAIPAHSLRGTETQLPKRLVSSRASYAYSYSGDKNGGSISVTLPQEGEPAIRLKSTGSFHRINVEARAYTAEDTDKTKTKLHGQPETTDYGVVVVELGRLFKTIMTKKKSVEVTVIFGGLRSPKHVLTSRDTWFKQGIPSYIPTRPDGYMELTVEFNVKTKGKTGKSSAAGQSYGAGQSAGAQQHGD